MGFIYPDIDDRLWSFRLMLRKKYSFWKSHDEFEGVIYVVVVRPLLLSIPLLVALLTGFLINVLGKPPSITYSPSVSDPPFYVLSFSGIRYVFSPYILFDFIFVAFASTVGTEIRKNRNQKGEE